MTRHTRRISIIIPNYNGKNMLRICLPSIWRQRFRGFHVIVVDNGSKDGSIEYMQAHFPEVELIRFDENRGFSEAVNAGIKRSQSELVFLLNNDTELDPGFLDQIVMAFDNNRAADFCAPKMLNYHQREFLDGAGDGFLRGGVGYRIGTMERDGEFFERTRWVFGACAGAAVYKRKIFEEAGYFDTDFFAYLEDLDLNLRAAGRGFKCLYVPQARVYHIGSATTGSKFNDFIVSRTTKNIVNVLVKNFKPLETLRALPLVFLHHLAWLLVVVRRHQAGAYVSGLRMAMADFPEMRTKRRAIVDNRRSRSDYLKGVRRAEKEVVRAIIRRRKTAGATTWPMELYLTLFK